MARILLKPKEVTIADSDGVEHTYILSRLPATDGRELVTQYPISAMPKVGDYKVNEALMLKLLSFVAVKLDDDKELQLTTRALVDNHTYDWETLGKLEVAMMEYNVSFFGNGRGLTFLEGITRKAEQWITATLIPSLQQSSRKDTQP